MSSPEDTPYQTLNEPPQPELAPTKQPVSWNLPRKLRLFMASAEMVPKKQPPAWSLPRKFKGLMARPRMAKPLPPSEPPPWQLVLMLTMAAPVGTAYLVFSADFSPACVAFAGGLAMLGVISFLVTPISGEKAQEDEGQLDDNEAPPMPLDLEHLKRGSTLLMSAKDMADSMASEVKAKAVGYLAPCLEPLKDNIAKGLQIFMGLSSFGQLYIMFSGVPFAAALINAICFAVQLPDSAAWLFEVPWIVTVTVHFNRYRLSIETSVMQSFEDGVAHAKACAGRSCQGLSPNRSVPQQATWLQGWRNYLTRKSIRTLNEIGLLLRESPLKSYVVLLNLIIALKDVELPKPPDVPWQALDRGGTTTAWPVRAKWLDNTDAESAAQANGTVSMVCSDASAAAWFPHVQSTLVLEYAVSFNVTELALYYVAASVPQFALELEALTSGALHSFVVNVTSLGGKEPSVSVCAKRPSALNLMAATSVSASASPCLPPPLRLQLDVPAQIKQLSLTLLDGSEMSRIGIRGVAQVQTEAEEAEEIEVDEELLEEMSEGGGDDSFGDDEGAFLDGMEDVDPSMLVGLSAATTTAAATTEFVRKRVRPKEVEQARERDAARKDKEMLRAAAEARLRRSIAARPLETSVKELDLAVAEAAETGVSSALIGLAQDRRAEAIRAREDLARRRQESLEALKRFTATPPLDVDLVGLSAAIDAASELDLEVGPLRSALSHHQQSAEAQKRLEIAFTRLDRAMAEPERAANPKRTQALRTVGTAQLVSTELEETWGLGVDIEELTAAIAEAKACGAAPALVAEMQRRLRRAIEAQSINFFATGRFASRLRGLAKARKRQESARLFLSRATSDCEGAVVEMRRTQRSALLELALETLSKEIEGARVWKISVSAAETMCSDAQRLLTERKQASARATQICDEARGVLEPANLRTGTHSKAALDRLLHELPLARSAAVGSYADPALEKEILGLERKAASLKARCDKGVANIRSLMELHGSGKMKMSSCVARFRPGAA